jgi:spermidine synthase
LIYEVVWFQLLELVIGSSAVSIGVLLGTFMGGMCLGSLLLPRSIPTRPSASPVRVLELGIGVIGLMRAVCDAARRRRLYRLGRHGHRRLLLRGVVAGICLLPPTLLMGATLPAIARWVEATPAACRGSASSMAATRRARDRRLLAGFYLLRSTTWRSRPMSRWRSTSPSRPSRSDCEASPLEAPTPAAPAVPWCRAATVVYVVIGLSGLTALSSECSGRARCRS